MTRLEVNRHLEDKVKELILGANLPLGHLADMLKRLIQRNIITKEQNKKSEKFNVSIMFTHQRDFDATLEITLESFASFECSTRLIPDTNDKRYEPNRTGAQFD